MKKSKKLLVSGIGLLLLILFINRVDNEKFKIDQASIANIEKLKEEVATQLPDNAELVSASEDKVNFIMNFEDANGNEKFLLPYKKDSSKKPLNIMVLTKEGNKWVEEERIALVGEDFDTIMFEDISGDGEKELIIGLKIGKSSTRGLSLYEYDNGELKEIASENYEDIFVADFDSDDISEVVLLKNHSKEKKMEINYYEYRDESLKIIDSIVLEETEAKVELALQKISSENRGLVAQLETESKKGVLSVFNIKNGKLERLSLLGEESIQNPFYVETKDINEDGIFEFPILKQSPGLTSKDNLTWITEWHSLNPEGELEVVKREYTDHEGAFTLEFFEEWEDQISIKRYVGRSGEIASVDFLRYSGQGGTDFLFEIAVYTTEDWSKQDREYREQKDIIAKSQKRVYILSSNESHYTIKDIKKKFRILENKEN
jgi:hypothetical protein